MRKLTSVLTLAAACLLTLVLVPRSAEGQTTAKTLVVRINGKIDSKTGTVYLTRLVSSISSTGTIQRRVDIYVNGNVGCRVLVDSLEDAIELREQITSPATTKITCVGTALVQNSINEAVVRTSGTTQGSLEIL